MSDSLKYWEESNFGEENKEEKLNENVQSVIDLYRLLDLQDKLTVRRIISQENLF